MSSMEWEKLVEEFKKSGKSQAQWCREKGLKVKVFNYHYRKLKGTTQSNQPNRQIDWIPVKLEAGISSKLSIRIGKAMIEVENGYDEKLLLSVVRSLEAIC